MSSQFKKRAVAPERVAIAESAAAATPMVGDPRMLAQASSQAGLKVSAEGSGTQPKDPVQGQVSAGKLVVGQVYDVPLGMIESNPVNPRALYTASAVDEMAISLATHGQRISATGYLNETGGVVLIEGETRLRGARAAGLPTLRMEIKPKPESVQALYEEARAANVERRDQTPLDDALKWKDMLARKIYHKQADLAKALSLSEDHVSRTLSLASMPLRVLHALAEIPDLHHMRTLNAIREYWEVRGDEDTLELILEAEKNGMGYREIVQRRKAAMAPPVKRPRSSREALSFRGASGELKTFEESGRVELMLKGLSPQDSAELVEKIKAIFPRQSN